MATGWSSSLCAMSREDQRGPETIRCHFSATRGYRGSAPGARSPGHPWWPGCSRPTGRRGQCWSLLQKEQDVRERQEEQRLVQEVLLWLLRQEGDEQREQQAPQENTVSLHLLPGRRFSQGLQPNLVLQRVHQHHHQALPDDLCADVREVLPTTNGLHNPALWHRRPVVLLDGAWRRRLHHGERVLQQHR